MFSEYEIDGKFSTVVDGVTHVWVFRCDALHKSMSEMLTAIDCIELDSRFPEFGNYESTGCKKMMVKAYMDIWEERMSCG